MERRLTASLCGVEIVPHAMVEGKHGRRRSDLSSHVTDGRHSYNGHTREGIIEGI